MAERCGLSPVPWTGQESADILRSLVDEIALMPGEGELAINVRGDLAGIPSLATASVEPMRIGGPYRWQIRPAT